MAAERCGTCPFCAKRSNGTWACWNEDSHMNDEGINLDPDLGLCAEHPMFDPSETGGVTDDW